MISRERALSAILAAAGVVAIASLPSSAASDDNWPQWRGPDGLGIAKATSYPAEWSPDKNIAWKVPVEGRGHSSPVIWGNYLFLTTSIKGAHVPGHTAPDHLDFNLKPGYLHPDSEAVDYRHTLKVLAYDSRTGKLLWQQTAYDGLMYDNRHRSNTYASSTVATDGKVLYAFFEAAGIYAYEFSGKPVWKASVGNIAKAGMGPGTSPVIWEDLLILQCDQEMGAGSAIVALDRKTGKQVWRTERTTRRSWATPLIVRAGSRTELIASGAEHVAAYDPRTGKELWRAPGVQSHPIPSAVAGHGLVYLSAGSAAKRALAIRPGGEGDITGTDRVVWRYQKGTAYTASPILYGDYLYLMSDGGILTCLDAKTGVVVYEGGRPPVAATFRSSLVAFGDRILQTSEEGDTFVIKAGPRHEVLHTNSVGEPVWASLAFAHDTIYIRGDKHLFAVRKTG
ncbi:MAG TPA: PQQ-binding-like beta-propeller repeat protein [Vicinamibacterales bacterium]|nr:PQQ-binding-like beta-propeller repeat protein [Vicinamibacterales bacterium]